MKSVKIQLIRRVLLVVISILTLGLSTSYTQIGDLGIYGSPPVSYRDNVRFVRLERYPATGDNVLVQTLPVNGLKNFNFFYTPDGENFLPGGGYRVFYLGSDEVTVYGYDIVSYSPNSSHTDGVKVRDFNSPPSTPRGVHGYVWARINGIDYPFANANIVVYGESPENHHATLRANGNGFFDAYYTNGLSGSFLPIDPNIEHEHYNMIVTGSLNGCAFGHVFNQLNAICWPLNTNDPTQATYWVTDAEADVGNLILEANNCAGD